MGKLVLIRHGQSLWNKKNIFTGWVDIPLSLEGVQEAISAGKELANFEFKYVFTSTLCRAQTTAHIILAHSKTPKTPVLLSHVDPAHAGWDTIHSQTEIIPIIPSWQLNERMYGDLQGLNKDETRKEFGKEQVELWRRSFDIPPPHGESLEMTAKRTIPFFTSVILPKAKEGDILIAAHGNSLRSIVMEIEKLSAKEVVSLEIPTGVPLYYEITPSGIEKI